MSTIELTKLPMKAQNTAVNSVGDRHARYGGNIEGQNILVQVTTSGIDDFDEMPDTIEIQESQLQASRGQDGRILLSHYYNGARATDEFLANRFADQLDEVDETVAVA